MDGSAGLAKITPNTVLETSRLAIVFHESVELCSAGKANATILSSLDSTFASFEVMATRTEIDCASRTVWFRLWSTEDDDRLANAVTFPGPWSLDGTRTTSLLESTPVAYRHAPRGVAVVVFLVDSAWHVVVADTVPGKDAVGLARSFKTYVEAAGFELASVVAFPGSIVLAASLDPTDADRLKQRMALCGNTRLCFVFNSPLLCAYQATRASGAQLPPLPARVCGLRPAARLDRQVDWRARAAGARADRPAPLWSVRAAGARRRARRAGRGARAAL